MSDYNPKTTPTKICTCCCNEYPATTEYFHKHPNGKLGLNSKCKVCICAYVNRYRLKNIEVVTASKKDWYSKNRDREVKKRRDYYQLNHDAAREHGRQYYIANKSSIKARQKEYNKNHRQESNKRQKRWRDNHPEKAREILRQKRAEHPDRYRSYARNYRAQKKNAIGTHTAADIQHQGDSQGWRCWYCQIDCTGQYEVDHRIPVSRGGSNAISNLVITCKNCNRSKSDKLPHEWGDRLL